jgi:hypothetical protein
LRELAETGSPRSQASMSEELMPRISPGKAAAKRLRIVLSWEM